MPDPKNPHGYAVGQSWVAAVERHGTSRREHRLVDVTIEKVGREWVYLDGLGYRNCRFPIESQHLIAGGEPATLYRNRESAEQAIAAAAAWLALYRQLTATPPPNVTAETVSAIRNLINLPEKPG